MLLLLLLLFACLLAILFRFALLSMDALAGILLCGGVVKWLIALLHVVNKNETCQKTTGAQTVRGDAPQRSQDCPIVHVTL